MILTIESIFVILLVLISVKIKGGFKMNVNEMMNMIDRKIDNDKEKERQKEIEERNRFDIAFKQIEALKPRIDDLLRLANYAKDNGYDLVLIEQDCLY